MNTVDRGPKRNGFRVFLVEAVIRSLSRGFLLPLLIALKIAAGCSRTLTIARMRKNGKASKKLFLIKVRPGELDGKVGERAPESVHAYTRASLTCELGDMNASAGSIRTRGTRPNPQPKGLSSSYSVSDLTARACSVAAQTWLSTSCSPSTPMQPRVACSSKRTSAHWAGVP